MSRSIFIVLLTALFCHVALAADDPLPKTGQLSDDIQHMIAEAEQDIAAAERQHTAPNTNPQLAPDDDTLYVYPEKKTYLTLSKADINRFLCEGGEVTGVIFSEDKGLHVTRSGVNAFLRIIPDGYAFGSPFELYMICGGDTLYRMIGDPQWVSARNVILKDGGKKLDQALDFFKGRFREESIVRLIRQSLKEEWDPAWTITPRYALAARTDDYKVTWYRSIDTRTQWTVEQYIIEPLAGEIRVEETAFVDRRTVAVSCPDPVIAPGKLGQVLVIREKLD